MATPLSKYLVQNKSKHIKIKNKVKKRIYNKIEIHLIEEYKMYRIIMERN